MRRTALQRLWTTTTVAAVLACAAIVGCERGAAPPAVSEARDVVDRGPFSFTVVARPAQATIGDAVELELIGHAPETHVVALPDAAAIEDAKVLDVEDTGGRPAETGVEWRRVIRLEPLYSGTFEIPPLVMRYGPRPTQPDAEPEYEHELATGTLKVEIASVLTDADEVTNPRDITGVLAPPPEPTSPWRIGAVAGAIAGAAAGVAAALWTILRRKPAAPPPVPAHVWALGELDALAAAGLIDHGAQREFYYRLSEIVRAYIERRFALAAPDMTTEEFLSAIARRDSALGAADSARLHAFLEACDVVKYAALEPGPAEARDAMTMARSFVESTASVAEREVGGRAA